MTNCDTRKQLSSFYSTYTSLCKEKNVPAILELIKSKSKLDFVSDRIRSDQWDLIHKSLECDNGLEVLAIRSRKSNVLANEQTESEKKNIAAPLMKSVSGCLKRNSILTILALEGLPLTIDDVQIISAAISLNSSLKTLSFARSSIMNDGCNAICCTVRDLPHIEKLNLSQCSLTSIAASYISELIKFQTMKRNSEGWMQSLRYRDVDVDSVPGLKCLILNGNALCDEGLEMIASKLQEDMWIKAIEVQNCELSDVGGEVILECLKFNKTLVVFDASHNYRISNKVQKKIQMILSTEPDNYEGTSKITNNDLREKIEFLEQRLHLEQFNRKRADELNRQLHRNLVKCGEEIAEKSYEPPSGYTIIESDDLNALYKEIENLSKAELIEPKAIATDVGDAQFGFGDTLIASERKCYASFIPFSREEKAIESNNLVDFTTYSEDWSCNVSSKFDEDTTTVNSDEVESVHNDESVCEDDIEFNPFHEDVFGDGNYEKVGECERNNLLSSNNLKTIK